MQTSDMTALQLEGIGYSSINTAFKKKVVFSVGYYAGFFSEINNMILAMIYCLKNNLKFTLNSKNSAIFGDKGWEEYFEPFTEEAAKPIPQKINFRITTNYKFRLKDILRILQYKFTTGTTYLTFDIWDKFYNESATSREVSNMINSIWKFNEKTQNLLKEKISSLNLPEKFIAIHIRGGDKTIEVPELYKPEDFMSVLTKISDNKNIFVFCDEYKSFEKLRMNYPDYKFWTLCSPMENGYNNSEFQKLDWDIRHSRIINLLTNIELCKNAELFIGTQQANPDYFITVTMENSMTLPLNIKEFHDNIDSIINSYKSQHTAG